MQYAVYHIELEAMFLFDLFKLETEADEYAYSLREQERPDSSPS